MNAARLHIEQAMLDSKVEALLLDIRKDGGRGDRVDEPGFRLRGLRRGSD
jgi:hypothetical protein